MEQLYIVSHSVPFSDGFALVRVELDRLDVLLSFLVQAADSRFSS